MDVGEWLLGLPVVDINKPHFFSFKGSHNTYLIWFDFLPQKSNGFKWKNRHRFWWYGDDEGIKNYFLSLKFLFFNFFFHFVCFPWKYEVATSGQNHDFFEKIWILTKKFLNSKISIFNKNPATNLFICI